MFGYSIPAYLAFALRGEEKRTLCPRSETPADLNDVVGDNSQADPSLYPSETSIAATPQPMAPLQYADATFASGPAALPGPEPTRSLQLSPLTTFRTPTRHRNSPHSHRLDGFFIL